MAIYSVKTDDWSALVEHTNADDLFDWIWELGMAARDEIKIKRVFFRKPDMTYKEFTDEIQHGFNEFHRRSGTLACGCGKKIRRSIPRGFPARCYECEQHAIRQARKPINAAMQKARKKIAGSG